MNTNDPYEPKTIRDRGFKAIGFGLDKHRLVEPSLEYSGDVEVARFIATDLPPGKGLFDQAGGGMDRGEFEDYVQGRGDKYLPEKWEIVTAESIGLESWYRGRKQSTKGMFVVIYDIPAQPTP